MHEVHKHIQLGLINRRLPLKVHVDVGGMEGSAVLIQGETREDYAVVSMLAKMFTSTELQCMLMECYFLCALCPIKQTAQYALGVPEIVIVLPWQAEAQCMLSSSLPARLQSYLVELSAFGCK